MYQVTIGIPLYNVEKYVRESMESALAQTFRSIEYLIVNDQSTDGSLSIVQDLQQHHPRGADIRVIHHPQNAGVAQARNTILAESRGKYLFFMDGDDLISPDCIEKLHTAAQHHQAEVVYASHTEILENQPRQVTQIHLGKVFTEADQLARYVNHDLHHTLNIFIWNILYELSFLHDNSLRFLPVGILEDHLFSYSVYPLVKRAVILSDVTYTYRKHSGSLSHYAARDHIPLGEIREEIKVGQYFADICKQTHGKPYSDVLITKAVMKNFDTAAVAVDKKKLIRPSLPASEIKAILVHPLIFSEIIRMKQYKLLNIHVYLLGISPVWVTISILSMYRWALKKYRSLR